MLNLKLIQFPAFACFCCVLILTGCGDDAGGPPDLAPTGNSRTYQLSGVSLSDIDGTARFIELNNGTTDVVLELRNTPAGGIHPSHIHMNSATAGGNIIITLEAIDGSTGESTTNVFETDRRTRITYAELIDFDGHIDVHLSQSNFSNLLALGDIGQNILSGESVTYDLHEQDIPGINGIARFEERMNGSTLATIALENTSNGAMHPAHIHSNDAETGGPISISLSPVNGTTGLSKTQISKTNAGETISYEDLLSYDGYIRVALSNGELGIVVAQGNIGINN